MAKIALIVPAFERMGGVSSVGLFVLEALRRLGHEVTPLSLSTSWRDEGSTLLSKPWEWFRVPECTPVILESGESIQRFGARFAEWEPQRYRPRVALTTLLHQFDVIQLVVGSAVWFGVCAGLKKPVFIQVATTLESERLCDSTHKGLRNRIRQALVRHLSPLEKQSLRDATGVFVENYLMWRYVSSLRSEVGTFFSPPGVDEFFFTPAERAGRLYFLFVGRVNDPRKNIGLLLQAYRRARLISDSLPKLILAGSDSPCKYIIDRIHELDLVSAVQIRVRPTKGELRDLYRNAIALVLPSLEEGLGVVILEAFACGTTAIATDCGGPGVIIERPEVGLLVKNRDEVGLALALNTLASDIPRANSMGLAARAVVERKFSYLACGRSFEDGYRKVLGSSFK